MIFFAKSEPILFMKILKILSTFVLLLLLPFLFYVGIAYLLTYFPTKGSNANPKNSTIYLFYDAIHSDIVIDLSKSTLLWHHYLPQLLPSDHPRGYLFFGWGDKATYLNTPTWDKLQPTVALKALFINTPSMMHVQHIYRVSQLKNLIKIPLSLSQQQTVEQHILESFGTNPHFVQQGYWSRDAFYDSPYPYNLFHTCNTWSGDILRESNISMSYWTPLSFNLISVLQADAP